MRGNFVMLNNFYIEGHIKSALQEDIGFGDITTENLTGDADILLASLNTREDGILCGAEVFKTVYKILSPKVEIKFYFKDGDEIKKGDKIADIKGPARAILMGERVSLNYVQRMSGIATMTNKYVKRLEGTKTRILDTRKTTPGMRMLEKEAVKIGGGVNHRIGLFDMILLKDNHIDFAGGIENAITRCHQYLQEKGKQLKIEIEVRGFDELNEVLRVGGVDRIMLDNFTPEQTRKAVELIGGKYETESSGGITYDTIRDYAECGVDFISVGALTHSVKGLDMSFKAVDSSKLKI